jgi:hypothetical protein
MHNQPLSGIMPCRGQNRDSPPHLTFYQIWLRRFSIEHTTLAFSTPSIRKLSGLPKRLTNSLNSQELALFKRKSLGVFKKTVRLISRRFAPRMRGGVTHFLVAVGPVRLRFRLIYKDVVQQPQRSVDVERFEAQNQSDHTPQLLLVRLRKYRIVTASGA